MDEPFTKKFGSEVEPPKFGLVLFRTFSTAVSHMGRPNRQRYRKSEVRVSSKVDDGKLIGPEMDDVTRPEVGQIVDF